MSLAPVLVELLVCPEDKGPLWYLPEEQTLYNERLRRRYAVREGIPVLLIDDATAVDDGEHQRLMQKIESDDSVRTGPAGTATKDGQ